MAAIRVGCAVMVEKEGTLLLGKRGKTPGFGNLVIPGGGVESYEELSDTARREVREETGVEIKNLRQFGTYQIINPQGEEHRIIIYWNADWESKDVHPSSDLLSAKFYTRSEIADEVQAGHIKGVVLDVLKDAGWI